MRQINFQKFCSVLFCLISGSLFGEMPQYPNPFPPKDFQNFAPEFKKSFETWQKYDEACEDNYVYVVFLQKWSNRRERTEVEVKDNEIIRRSFIRMKEDFENVWHREEWEESTPEDIGKHTEGAPPKKAEELYEICQKEVLTKNTKPNLLNEKKAYYFLRFKTDHRDLLYECLYRKNTCVGDCWKGVRMHEILFQKCDTNP